MMRGKNQFKACVPMALAQRRTSAPIPDILRLSKNGHDLAKIMNDDRRLFNKVSRALASDEFYGSFLESGKNERGIMNAVLTDLLVESRWLFKGDERYEREICAPIRAKYLAGHSGRKSAEKK